jgi:2-oxoglutarate dehydrogenase E2 component (dihydrolipoamide succinyltransferase)
MPQLGETVSEGTVTRWLRGQGDTVAAGDPLLEIASDKVSMEVPSLQAGVLLEVLVEEGETVPVGAALAWLEVEGEDTGTVAEAPAARDVGPPAGATAPQAPTGPHERRPSPLVRRLLQEAGLTAAEVTGSGPRGRILREDVAAAAGARATAAAAPPAAVARPPAAPAATPAVSAATPDAPAATPAVSAAPVPPRSSAPGDRTEPLSRLRAVIAERMVTSLQTSAQLTSVVEVDVTRIAQLRARARSAGAGRGVKLSFLPFFARAAVEALESHATVNASVDTTTGTVTYHDAIHLAIAVDTERGLLAPVVRDADRLSLVGLSGAIADLAERTRTGSITADELSGGTFTLTNTGSRGALFDTPIINQPQVAILATGAVTRRPVVVSDPASGTEGIGIRSMVYLALTYDHRLIDGAVAAHFLVTVKQRLEGGRFESDLGLPSA